MSKIQKLDQGMEVLFQLSSTKFLFVVYAFMCVWSKTVTDTILSVSLSIDYVFGFDLRSIYSFKSSADISFIELAFGAPILETLVFQSVIQNLMRKITDSIKWSILISAIIFSLCHAPVNVAYALNAFGLGLALATIYEYFRAYRRHKIRGHKIAFSITFGIHAFWNISLTYGLFPDKLMS
ncbi:hypothetical protein BOO91_18735 [Vibrio navarrensis]|nr:CPBP family intramembrane glutamic endopeptidase [Vibrio navarrensis]MBE3662972.1 hypothetical protein [Vibrio navarrensis]MBE4606086.1 hypothetical protein [Vibrio navarrensis]